MDDECQRDGYRVVQAKDLEHGWGRRGGGKDMEEEEEEEDEEEEGWKV